VRAARPLIPNQASESRWQSLRNALDLRDLLSDELVQRQQSGYHVDDALAAGIRAALSSDRPDADLAELYDQLDQTALRPGWDFEEPTELAGIVAAAPGALSVAIVPDGAELEDRIHAAWLGRCAGCNLGKPVEGHGWDRGKLREYLTEADSFPLDDYVPVLDPMPEGYTLHPSWPDASRGRVVAMARDDDLDYTVLGLRTLEMHGASYTTADVAELWLDSMPFGKVYTAERVAYRNLVYGLQPPASARYRNPYREWIGAMIRADIFGYVSPGDPQRAAQLAYADAAVSHTGNGIYSEMWAAALIAAAFTAPDASAALQQALLVVPARSRLAASLRAVLDAHQAGRSWEQAMESMEQRLAGYHWVHAINNAEVISAALLWGEGDFSRTIGLAVEAALDTDCDGATAGSVFGALHGTKAIPVSWTDPLHDTLHSAVFGFDGVAISGLARRTAALTEPRVRPDMTARLPSHS
jgi:ADP-ribosylglycohydrolase